MGKINRPVAKGCAILAAVIVGVPLLIASVVGLKTWGPLKEAGQALEKLDQSLGSKATYIPSASGGIPAERMELFLSLRQSLFPVCEDYLYVRKGFDSVAALDSETPADLNEAGDAAAALGGASLSITPFLAGFFECRNNALLKASMGLQEYSYIYAIAYHDHLLSKQTRNEIFSDDEALSREASILLKGCLARQMDGLGVDEGPGPDAVARELDLMASDPTRLIWQDGLPEDITASVQPHRERLNQVFCGATAGLEMEQNARRAIRVALE